MITAILGVVILSRVLCPRENNVPEATNLSEAEWSELLREIEEI